MISFVNFGNFNQIRMRNNGNLTSQPTQNQLKPLAQDTVNFTGASKVLTDVCDKAFVNILIKDLELGEQYARKLKNVVWDFLRENKVRSLGELGGEEHFDEQVELVDKIRNAIDLPDDLGEFLSNEVIKRCDEGADYVPDGWKGFQKHNMSLEDILTGKVSLSKGMDELVETGEDDTFFKYTKKMLRQTPEENYEFQTTVEEFLARNNIKSIKELFKSEDLLNEQAALMEQLERKFNLSEDETYALNFEFLQRANLHKKDTYKPVVTEYVKDAAPLLKVVKDGNYECNSGQMPFVKNLFKIMAEEAGEKGFKNIFEVVKSENKLIESKTYDFIMKSNLSENQKINLIIDLTKVSKQVEEFAQGIPKHPSKDNFYANIQTDMIKDKLSERFKMKMDTSEFIRKIFPAHVAGGQGCNYKQIAFEIADSYNLPTGAEKEIEKIIQEVIDGGTESADKYFISKLTK